MATGYRQKTLCSVCQKAVGAFTCRGCRKDFCNRHVNEHRQELSKQMDDIIINHDQLQQNIVEQEAQPNCHPLIKKIDEWEQESIEKIHRAANNVRQELLAILNKYRIQVKEAITNVTTELITARNEDDYTEMELNQWTEKLNELKNVLNAMKTVDFNEEIDENSLIPKIFIHDPSHDIFYQIKGDIQISEGGKVVTHTPSGGLAVARCRGEYSHGQHQFHFRIEDNNRYGGSNISGIICGIIPKNIPIDSVIFGQVTYNNHGQPMTGCLLNANLKPNAVCHVVQSTYIFYAKVTYELSIDCDHKKIRLSQNQNATIQEVKVDTTTFPFPWQFFVALLHPSLGIRLC